MVDMKESVKVPSTKRIINDCHEIRMCDGCRITISYRLAGAGVADHQQLEEVIVLHIDSVGTRTE